MLMTDYMRLRGPAACGFWVTEGAALGHRRLAILDLDYRANQPMVSNDGSYAIIFNGEIYNFRELRRALEAVSRMAWARRRWARTEMDGMP